MEKIILDSLKSERQEMEKPAFLHPHGDMPVWQPDDLNFRTHHLRLIQLKAIAKKGLTIP